jgi:iron complex transport system substrate-binding protein
VCDLRRSWIAALALGAVAALTTFAGAAPPGAGSAPAAQSAAAPGALRVTDATGRVVALAAPPRRIVVVGHGPYMIVHLLYMFPGARQRLVGMEERGGVGSEFLPLVDSTFTRKRVLRNPGPEEIAALHPDLVITRGPTLDALGRALGQLRIPVVSLGLETPEQFSRDVTNLGILLGDPGRARAINAFYQSRLVRIRAGWQGAGRAARPRVLLLEYSERGGAAAVRVPARPWMQTLEVEAAGGDAVWLDGAAITSGWTVTNIEQIARWNPDQIVLAVWHTLDPAQVMAALRADPQWSALRAVKDGEIHAFPSDYYGWDSPDPRWLLGMMWLAKTLHPDCFADLDLRREIHEFFGTLYGMDASVIDAGIMPRIRLDVR